MLLGGFGGIRGRGEALEEGGVLVRRRGGEGEGKAVDCEERVCEGDEGE